jgi:predicted sulfurtransferase
VNVNIGDVREMLECGTATSMELTEAVEFLLRERRTLGREIVRLKIAHLRRMAQYADGVKPRAYLTMVRANGGIFEIDRANAIESRLRRFAAACLAKIAELKESQCSIKS